MPLVPILCFLFLCIACGGRDSPDPSESPPSDSDTSGAIHPGPGLMRISEIMFEPRRSEPRERFDGQNWGPYVEIDEDAALEYVELHNAGAEALDLSGWGFTDGIDFTFPAGTRAEPGSHLVVAADPERFALYFGKGALGPFEGALGNGGETLALTDATWTAVDTVSYESLPPWPVRPGTLGASLERVSAQDDRSTVENWRSSTSVLPEPLVGTGTPGAVNSVAGAIPPFIEDLGHEPLVPEPGGTLAITARVSSGTPIASVEVELAPHGEIPAFEAMADDGAHGDGGSGDGVFGAFVPAGSEGGVTHYRIHVDTGSSTSVYPYDDEPSATRAYAATAVSGERSNWHLFMRSADIETLRAAASLTPQEDPEVDGTLVVDGVAYPHVRVSLGGRWLRAFEPYAWHIAFNPDAPHDGATSLHANPYNPEVQQVVFEAFDKVLAPCITSELADIRVMSDDDDGAMIPYVVFGPPNGPWLDGRGYDDGTEVYKARSVESSSPRRNSDLFWFGDPGDERADNGLQTNHNLWGAYKKGERALDPPDELRDLITALNDVPDDELAPWLDAHVDVEQWFTSIALHIYLRIDDFAGHNYYLLLPGDPGGRWQVLSYDFDGFARYPALPALYATGLPPDESPDWQRNMLHRRIAGSPTLGRVYFLYLRRLLEAFPPETLVPASYVSPVAEARDSLMAELDAANLPSSIDVPVAVPCGGPPTEVRIMVNPGWQAYATTDGSDPRLSATRIAVGDRLVVDGPTTLRLAAVEAGFPIEEGRWTDDVACVFTAR